MTKPRHTIEDWIRELADNQMPAFAQTAQAIASKAGDEEGSTSELAKLILQDVAMTTRVLRMASSSYFNPAGGKINTVSRAIIVLGFNTVRDLCLSISFVDTFVQGPDREYAVREMVRSFHAALQARQLAELMQQKEPEEVFIATLLYHLGSLAFWCFASRVDAPTVARLREAIANGCSAEEAELDVLGFRIESLTALLNRKWRLSPLLATALDPGQPASPRTRSIHLGHALAHALDAGPGSPAMTKTLREIEQQLALPAADVRERMLATARVAADTLQRLGAPDVQHLIPVAGEDGIAAEPAALPAFHDADPELQMDILRELSQLLLESRLNANLLLQMVLEGIHRGVGMDRAVFALLTPDRTAIRAKFVLGEDRSIVQSGFSFPVVPANINPFARALQQGEPLWVGAPETDPAARRIDPALKHLSGGACFIMPLTVAGKAIGCLYADRALSGRALDEELFHQFKLFGQQARMGLAYLKS